VHSNRKIQLRIVAFAATMTLLVAACGGSSKKSNGNTSGGNAGTVNTTAVPTGGTLTIGAEQEPDCLDFLSSCAGASWGSWTAQIATLPMAFRTAPTQGQPPNSGNVSTVPGPVLDGEPTLETTPVQKITYKINPAAVWSDGVAITCADFQYVVNQQQTGSDLYDPTGYPDIASVTCPNDKTAVVTYKQGKTFANWKTLFSGNYGLLPSHLLKGKDRDAAMKDGYSWSGGPWIAKWTKGDNITLTQNPKFWGPKPKLDKVVFKFITDTATEFQAVKSGQVDAIYPQPQIDVVDQIAAGGLNNLNTVYNSNTASVEALWMNNAKFPFDTVEARQAVSYAIDRAAIVEKLFGKLGVTTPWNSLNEYVVKDYANLDAFANYKLDLSKVNELMGKAGFTKGSDGIWAKGGKKAAFAVNTTAGNKRRELTEQVLQQQLKTAGFDMTIQNMKAGDLFGDALPKGDYTFAIYAQNLTAIAPGLCTLFCSSNIPTAANGNSGQNWTRSSVPEADPLLQKVDSSLNDNERMTAGKQADDILATNVVSLPLDPLPDILIWNKKVLGPVQDNPVESMFWNLDQWGIQQ
jgi:peptide/nickel transport system substrate-binding protein